MILPAILWGERVDCEIKSQTKIFEFFRKDCRLPPETGYELFVNNPLRLRSPTMLKTLTTVTFAMITLAAMTSATDAQINLGNGRWSPPKISLPAPKNPFQGKHGGWLANATGNRVRTPEVFRQFDPGTNIRRRNEYIEQQGSSQLKSNSSGRRGGYQNQYVQLGARTIDSQPWRPRINHQAQMAQMQMMRNQLQYQQKQNFNRMLQQSLNQFNQNLNWQNQNRQYQNQNWGPRRW